MKSSAFFWKVFMGVFVMAMVLVSCQKETLPLNALSDGSELLTLRGPEDKPPATICPAIDKITVQKTASATDIMKALKAALKEAEKKALGPRVKGAYKSAQKTIDSTFCAGIKSELEEWDGVSFPYYYTCISNGYLIIVALRIQVLTPVPPPSQAHLQAHENGHSHITKEITERCAKKASEDAKKAGKKGNKHRDAVKQILAKLDKDAQKAYETRTNHGQNGTPAQQGQWAQEEADKVINKYLAS